MEYSNLFVVLMGLGTTFFGLSSIILLIFLMGKIVGGAEEKPAAPAAAAAAPAPAVDREKEKEVVAAIVTSIAHELDISPAGVRIMSIKKR